MTSGILALAAMVVVLGVLLAWTQDRSHRRVERLITEARQERQAFLALLAQQAREATEERRALADERRALADRIQHPERIQVPPSPDYKAAEPLPDETELAHVGQIVPEFVTVGTPAPDHPAEEEETP